jgi:glycosyltransferase involved in cell wall biosynthesis
VTALAKRNAVWSKRLRMSVIVTTYNRPNALAAVLDGLLSQEDPSFEVIIADDGSSPETAAMLRSYGTRTLPEGMMRLVHAWQPDDGFRASAARNMAAARSTGDYLIFLDGDCIPRPDFVSRHRLLAETGFLVSGSRVLLSEEATRDWLMKSSAGAEETVHRQALPYWLGQRILRRTNKFLPLLFLPGVGWRHYRRVEWRRIKSCNLGVWRSDYESVDGFDERFVGWGHEDADLVLRLARSGVRRKSGAFATEVFHLWHRENPRGQESENRQRVQERLQTGQVRADVGLSAHPADGERVTVVAGQPLDASLPASRSAGLVAG